MNTLFIIGNITRDAELKNVSVNGKETPRCRFTVAVDEKTARNEKIVSYFQVTLWENYAVKMAPYLTKGKQVHVTGSVRMNQYTGANKVVYTQMQIHGATVTLLGGNREEDRPAEEVEEAEIGEPEQPQATDAPAGEDDLPF